ncbi:unnamed protein product [Clonostachys solani]|uniref:Uncharacterized protein n=1 Tax=Clonostachys solani TaxID=160281 RepID=A0A9N9ZMV7_9HYPO|nr:unnamed protein product [Clonostachys solani]
MEDRARPFYLFHLEWRQEIQEMVSQNQEGSGIDMDALKDISYINVRTTWEGYGIWDDARWKHLPGMRWRL